MKKILKKLFISLVLMLSLFSGAFYLYSLKYPVTAKIQEVNIYSYSDNEKFGEHVINCIQCTVDQYQYFNTDEIISLDPNDYIQVIYYCRIKNNSFSDLNSIYGIVSDLPKDEKCYMYSPKLDPKFMFGLSRNTVQCNVIICTKGLSKNDIIQKIKSVSVDLIFLQDNESERIAVKGIDTLKASDIQYKDW